MANGDGNMVVLVTAYTANPNVLDTVHFGQTFDQRTEDDKE